MQPRTSTHFPPQPRVGEAFAAAETFALSASNLCLIGLTGSNLGTIRLTSNLRLILLLINRPLNFIHHRVKRRKRQPLPLPNTRLPSVRDTFVDEDRLDVVDAGSEYGEES